MLKLLVVNDAIHVHLKQKFKQATATVFLPKRRVMIHDVFFRALSQEKGEFLA